MNLLINIIAFKIGWISAVLGGASGMALAGTAVVFVAIGVHLFVVAEPSRELTLIVLVGLVGLCSDSILVAAGWLTYSSGTIVAGLAPYWIVAMWMLFATTLNVTFRWLRSRLVLAAAIGAISGPASYYAGSRIGAVEFTEFVPAVIGLGVAWMLLFPTFLLLAKSLDGTQSPVLQSRI
jgi:hypothetical protein